MQEREKAEFQKEVQAWLRENKPPKTSFIQPQSFMEVGTDQQFEYLRDWQRKVYEAGYLGMAWPEEYGGGGKAQSYQDIVNREMAKMNLPFMVNIIGLSWAGPLILNMGTDAQKKKYIKNILSAEDIWCQGFSEPDHGSDLANAQLRAVRDGEDYILNGSKIWTTLAHVSKYMILLARTNPKANTKYEGLSFFLSPMDAKGIDIVPIKKMTGEYGFNQVFFSDARIPADCMMGKEGEGWMVAVKTLQFERGAKGGQAGGTAAIRTSVAEVVDMAKKAMRAGRPAIEDPSIQDKIIAFMIEEKAMRLNSARGRIKALAMERPGSLAMSGKLLESEFQRRLGQFAISLQGMRATYYMGERSAIEGGRWQRSYFNAFSATIGGGTSEIQKNIIGERVLGLPKG